MLPFKIYTRKRIFNYYTGLSFFIFIWICKQTKDEIKLVRHEKIHYLQQLELLFIFHWILYAFFYLLSRYRGFGHYLAYRYNPFELEAYSNEHDVNYLRHRRPFAWYRCIKEYYQFLARRKAKRTPQEGNTDLEDIPVTIAAHSDRRQR